MAENFVLSLAQAALGELASYAADEIVSARKAKKELRRLERSLGLICAFIRDAEKKQSTSESVKHWLKDMKHVVYDIDDLLDEAAIDASRLRVLKQGSNKLDKVRYFYLLSKQKLISPFTLSSKIKEVREKLNDIAKLVTTLGLSYNFTETVHVSRQSRHRITDPFVNRADIKGRSRAKKEVVAWVLRNAKHSPHGLSVLPIVGIGGLGKTTLAQLVYSDPNIDKEFDIRLWGCVSDPFDLESIIKRILQSINQSALGLGQMKRMLRNIVHNRRYFLVLDDVWTRNANEWNDLKDVLADCGAKGSSILLTTRDEKVATTVGTEKYYDLEKLSFDASMSLFMGFAFGEGEGKRYHHLVEHGKVIVKKCGGVPLAVKTLGSMLRGVRDEREWLRIVNSDLWNIEQNEGDIIPALKLSYNVLSSQLKLCFANLSASTKGSELSKENLIHMWIAQGLIKHGDICEELEETGERYIEELLSRSLLEECDEGATCRMHDLVHDLAMDVIGEELALVENSDDDKVSNFVRHMIWDLPNKEVLPTQSLLEAQQMRTFRLARRMGSMDNFLIKQVISTFKRLRVLDLLCSEIEELPDSIGELKHLRYLSLAYNQNIKALPNSMCTLVNLQTLYLLDCVRLKELPKDMGKLINLRHLRLTLSQQSEYLLPKQLIHSLRFVQIYSCKKLVSLMLEDGESGKIRFPPVLRIMDIYNCSRLSSLLPNSLLYLSSLRKLSITNCESLDWQLPPQHRHGRGMLPHGLRNLETLKISGVPKMVKLPDGLRTAADSLSCLDIHNCRGLTSLPDWLRNFKFLLKLVVDNCPNLDSIFQSPPALQELHIRDCPLLRLKCAKNRGVFWPHISHIPNICADGQWIQGGENTNP